MLLKNKRSQDLLTGTIIFVILNVAFFSIMLLYVSQTATGADFIEKKYARQICLAIDNLKPGTTVEMYIPELFDAAKKNNIKDEIFDMDYEKGTLTVRAASGKGNSYKYFTNLYVGDFSWDIQKKIVILSSEKI